MNRWIILALPIVIFIGCESDQQGPLEIPSYTIEQFYDNLRVTGGSFSPDNSKLLCSSNATGIFNAVAYPTDGGDPTPLTQSTEESIFTISYLPTDERFLYTADKGGDEINHIYLQETNGETRDLTPGPQEKASFFKWARDLEHFYYTSNLRDPNFFDLYRMQIDEWQPELVYQNDKGLDLSVISDDEKFHVLTQNITTSSNEMFLVDRTTGSQTKLSSEDGGVSYNPQYFSSDNESLYYLTDEEKEFQYLVKYDLESGNKTTVFETNWDVWYAYESWGGKYRVVGINADGKTQIKVFDLGSGLEIDIPDIDGKSISSVSISRDETKMRLTADNSKSPSDIYVFDFATKEYVQLTNTLNPEINPEVLVEGEVVRFPSFDGLSIPAIYYKPQQASKDHKVPALVWVHGGPGGQSRVSFFELIQYLVNQGYAVLAVNNRGSSGYGKTFYKMDDRKHGDVDLKDCIYGKKWLATQDYIDAEKIGIIGGSYGGYMVMAALAFAPEEFDVGVNIFGVTNWLRTLKSTPAWWGSFRDALFQEMGDPFSDDSVRLANISPLFHADQVTKPLMVLQGANDPRVLQVESDEIVEGVRNNGIPVEYVLFPDEGHGFRKKENQISGYGQIVTFLNTYLKEEKVVAD